MLNKNKQFKIERKKLVLSKDKASKDTEILKYRENDYLNGEKRGSPSKRPTLSQMPQNLPSQAFKRRSMQRDSAQKKTALTLQKKQTSASDNKQGSFQPQQQSSKGPNNEGGIRLMGRNAAVQFMINGLLLKMRQKQQFFQCKINSFVIQKNYFAHVIEYILHALSSEDLEQCHRLFHKMGELKDVVEEMRSYCQSHQFRQRAKTIAISSEVWAYEYNREDYERTTRQNANLVEHYSQLKGRLEVNLKDLESEIAAKEQQNEQLAREIVLKKFAVDEYCIKIEELEKKYESVDEELSEKLRKYANTAQEIKKLENFGSENREMIKIVSQEYKQIEADIYEYAVYLQSNELASQLHYEPHPFTEIERNLVIEYEGANSENLPEVTKAMKAIFQKLLSFYRKKDAEIVRLCEFKTKCIRQFISNMKKWLNNWELKQEFLVNLRNEFLVENENYHKLEDELEEVMDRERLEVENCLKELKKTYTKLEENYKLGNSFY